MISKYANSLVHINKSTNKITMISEYADSLVHKTTKVKHGFMPVIGGLVVLIL